MPKKAIFNYLLFALYFLNISLIFDHKNLTKYLIGIPLFYLFLLEGDSTGDRSCSQNKFDQGQKSPVTNQIKIITKNTINDKSHFHFVILVSK